MEIQSSPITFNVLTEEIPNIDEIRLMLAFQGYRIPESYTNKNIITTIQENVFTGEWSIITPEITVYIKLFKGKTSSVDYMLFSGGHDLTTGDAGDALCILESTKTSDKTSRNTATYQRISKFITYSKMYPNSTATKIMFWIDSKWGEHITDTAKMGFRMMETLNIKLYSTVEKILIDIRKKYSILPFDNADDLIECKNEIRQKKGNQSIRMRRGDGQDFYISLKLDKGSGKDSGRISHDPNVGFLSAVLNCLEQLEPGSKYILENHGINQIYFDKLRKSKLWYSFNNMRLEFTGCDIKNIPSLPDKYFKIEDKMTEKLCTILCEMVSNDNTQTIFSNHGGCALTSIVGNDCEECVGQKMPRPDIVFANNETKEILIIEGKVERDLSKGITQLSDVHLEGFIAILKKLYPDYQIKKGLCITISDIETITKYNDIEFPIKFALDNNGRFIDLR